MSSAREVLHQRAVRHYLSSTAFGSVGLNLMVTVLFKQAYDITGDGVADNVITTGMSPDEVTGSDVNSDSMLTDRSISIRVNFGDVLDDKTMDLVREVDVDDCDLS